MIRPNPAHHFPERFRREISPNGNLLAKYFLVNFWLEKFCKNNFTKYVLTEHWPSERAILADEFECGSPFVKKDAIIGKMFQLTLWEIIMGEIA